MNVRLDPMTDDEYVAFYDAAVARYAESHVAAGSWPAGGALERSVREHAGLLPEGLASPGNYLYTARDGDRAVGMIWFARRPEFPMPTASIYNVIIEPDLRGKGYGDAVMVAAEPLMLAMGIQKVTLHVFGDNGGQVALPQTRLRGDQRRDGQIARMTGSAPLCPIMGA